MEKERVYRQLSEEISITELWSILKRKLGVIFISIVSFGVLAFLVTQFLITPIYQSSALLIVNNRKDNSSENISSEELTSSAKLASLYNIIIKSSSVMDPVVRTVVSDWTANDLANNVKVTSVDSTQIIRITVSHKDPQLAQRYVKEIVTIAPDVIREAVEAGSVKVIEYPRIPTSSSSPNLKLNLLIAMLLGAMLSIGLIFLNHFMDQRIKTPEDIEELLSIPVIGLIPHYELKAQVVKGRKAE